PGAAFAIAGDRLYGLSSDRTAVYQWSGTGTDWTKVGGPAQDLYAGGAGLFATNPDTGSIFRYSGEGGDWTRVGDAGAAFAATGDRLYGLSSDRTAVYQWSGTGTDWTKVGGPAQDLIAGGAGLFATNPDTGSIFRYSGEGEDWSGIGSAGSSFTAGDHRLYGLSPDHTTVSAWSGTDTTWTSLGAPRTPPPAPDPDPAATPADPAPPATDEPPAAQEPTSASVQATGPPDTLDEQSVRMAVTAQDDLYTLSADSSALWKRGSDGWSPISGPASAVYAGWAGVFMTGPGSEQIRKYNADNRSWDPIAGSSGQFAVTGEHLYRLTPHDGIGEWHGDTWTKIGGPAGHIYAGRAGLFATNPDTGDLYQYNGKPDKWTRIGGPGATFAVGHDHVYRLSPDHTAVYEWTGKGTAWTRIGGPAQNLYAGGAGLFATNRDTGNIHQYNNTPDAWTEIGGPGATFAVSDTQLYGLSPDLTTTYRWNGTGQEWTRIGGAADVAQQQQDEQLLAANCEPGRNCVQEYREAKKILETSVTDWLKDNSADILLDLFSIDDIIQCAHKDAASCLEVAIDAGSTVLSVGAFRKAAKSTKAVGKVATDLPKFLETADRARDRYNKLRTIIDLAKATRAHLPSTDESGVSKPKLTSQPNSTDTDNRNRCGWAVLDEVDKNNGNRATGVTACLTQAYIDENPGTKTDISRAKPPGYDWAGRAAAYLHTVPSKAINACHLLGKQLSGSGSNLQNLATCARGTNDWSIGSQQGDNNMKNYEDKVAAAVKAGQDVHYQVTPKYSGRRTVPIGFRMSAYGITPTGAPGIEINVFVSNTLAGRNLGMFNDQNTNRQIPTGSMT
ncbi:DNA/RNA non-specific endonuclease, partial [Streptomyces sp. H39-C1]|uniref:DNA/RNA non-specific endonuclease n=1 Tax=Streptomyces sp. H39-C1 TaxID=3004355 RepID=UPI0022AE85AD